MMVKIFDLSFEIDGDAIELEQDAGCGEVNRICLHPVHVRLLAEQTGLLAPSSNIEADATIARLSRHLRTLHDRIDRLDDWIRQKAENGREDLEAESIFSYATWELSSSFIEDLVGNAAGVTPALPAADVRRMSPSEADKSQTESGQALPLFEEAAA